MPKQIRGMAVVDGRSVAYEPGDRVKVSGRWATVLRDLPVYCLVVKFDGKRDYWWQTGVSMREVTEWIPKDRIEPGQEAPPVANPGPQPKPGVYLYGRPKRWR